VSSAIDSIAGNSMVPFLTGCWSLLHDNYILWSAY